MKRSPAQVAWVKELNSRHPSATPGMKNSRPWRIWRGMVTRCYWKPGKDYPRYGGRGIAVCDKWRSFAGFWTDMQHGYADHLQLDRKNGSGNYVKSNCRWVTVKQQQRNRRSNKYVNTPKGRMLLIEASEVFGIPYGCLKMRRNWPESRLLEPKRPHVRKTK